MTGGVYKARERIHGAVADAPLLAKLHGVGLQTPIRTGADSGGLAPPRGFASLCTGHCSTCAALGVRAILT